MSSVSYKIVFEISGKKKFHWCVFTIYSNISVNFSTPSSDTDPEIPSVSIANRYSCSCTKLLEYLLLLSKRKFPERKRKRIEDQCKTTAAAVHSTSSINISDHKKCFVSNFISNFEYYESCYCAIGVSHQYMKIL